MTCTRCYADQCSIRSHCLLIDAFTALGTAIARFCREQEVAESVRVITDFAWAPIASSIEMEAFDTALNRLATLALEPTGGAK